jgi:hypothetical protein
VGKSKVNKNTFCGRISREEYFQKFKFALEVNHDSALQHLGWEAHEVITSYTMLLDRITEEFRGTRPGEKDQNFGAGDIRE